MVDGWHEFEALPQLGRDNEREDGGLHEAGKVALLQDRSQNDGLKDEIRRNFSQKE